MSEWRPEGLTNPHKEEFRYGKPYGRAKDWEDTIDAMLAALRAGGVHGQYTTGVYEGPWIVDDDGEYLDIGDVVSDENARGYLVFIPDKE